MFAMAMRILDFGKVNELRLSLISLTVLVFAVASSYLMLLIPSNLFVLLGLIGIFYLPYFGAGLSISALIFGALKRNERSRKYFLTNIWLSVALTFIFLLWLTILPNIISH